MNLEHKISEDGQDAIFAKETFIFKRNASTFHNSYFLSKKKPSSGVGKTTAHYE